MKTLFFKTCPIFSSILVLLCILLTITKNKYRTKGITIMFSFLLLCLYTHRVPENLKTENNPKLITSPAFGKIVEIGEIGTFTRICIFLNLDDVHVQYMPTDGLITKKEYKQGEFNPANLIEKGESNERLETYISPSYNNDSTIIVNQIAGMLARTIIHFKNEGYYGKKGDLIGIIQFGSRVDLYIPTIDINKILVNIDDVVKGPETPMVTIK
tara:strand:- start:2290 stop:2928 length:639 start_codon:yes stop_codon:yes gene_type:complete